MTHLMLKVLLFTVVLILPMICQAEGDSNLDKAFNDYYKTLRSKKNIDRNEALKLRKQTVGPENAKTTRAIIEKHQTMIKSWKGSSKTSKSSPIPRPSPNLDKKAVTDPTQKEPVIIHTGKAVEELNFSKKKKN